MNAPTTAPVTPAGAVPQWPSLRQATALWAQIGLVSFGGPAGQISLMHRALVEERRWISDKRFLHALNYCMLIPGPEAHQLATYLGWLLHGARGGLIAGTLFVLPGMLAIFLLTIAYVVWGDVPLIAGLLFGLKSAVLAIVLAAVIRLGRRALRSPPLVAIAAAAFIALFVFGLSFPFVILVAALVGLLVPQAGSGASHSAGGMASSDAPVLIGDGSAGAFPARAAWKAAALLLAIWLVALAAMLFLGDGGVFSRIATFFSGVAVVTFGGAYAILAYVSQAAVETFAWLTPQQMIDGLGLAETTPGPLLLVLQFVGFVAGYGNPGGLDPVVAGLFGGLLASFVTFVPSMLWVFLGAPFSERLRDNRILTGMLSAITAAVVGVILNLALWFAMHTLFGEVRIVATGPIDMDVPVLGSLDLVALALAVAAGVALIRFKISIFLTIAVAAVAGAVVGLARGGL